jgi:hypothetical protein
MYYPIWRWRVSWKQNISEHIIIIIIIIIITAIEFSLGAISPYTSRDKTNKNKYALTITKNTVNTSTHITKTPTHYKIHTYTHQYITKQVKTTTAQDTHQMK